MLDFPIQRPEGLSDSQWKRMVYKALRLVKQFTPVKTGRLKNGWTIGDLGEDGIAHLVNPVPYSVFVNDGTPRMAPRDMTGQTLAALM